MWIRKIIYILIMLLTAYITLMYEGTAGGIILAFMILILILLFAVSWYQKAGISIQTATHSDVVECDDKTEVCFQIRNRSVLPAGDVSLQLIACNTLDAEDQKKYWMRVKVPARDQLTAPFEFTSTYCGVIRIELLSVRVYDMMRIFSRKKKYHRVFECLVMPKLREMNVYITEASKHYNMDSDVYDTRHSGDDPAEIFRVREFRDGDKMSHVHWKMTARMDEMMIKELSLPIGNKVAVYLDVRYSSIEEAETLFSMCYSLITALVEQDCAHRLIWCCNQEELIFEEMDIREPETVAEAMKKLLSSVKSNTHFGWEEYLRIHPQFSIYRLICVTNGLSAEETDEFYTEDGIMKTVLTEREALETIEI